MKIIIPVAGFGTRFLPAVKSIPKELLPIIDKPVLQYAIEEVVSAGFQDIILVTATGKQAIQDHFNVNLALESHLKKFNKRDLLNKIRKLSNLANFTYVYQKEFYGNGFCVLAAEHLIKDEPFAVTWGDEFFVSRKPRFSHLLDVYNKYNSPVLMAVPTDDEGTKRFGIIEGKEIDKNLIQIQKAWEKPGPKKTKSRIGSIGGYILTPDVIPILKTQKRELKAGQELYLFDAICELIKQRPVYAKIVKGEFMDCGTKFNWLKTNIIMGLRHPEIKKDILKFIKKI